MDAILMPQIGQDITKGKIVEWLKKEDDPVEKGEVIAVVESEKASFDVEADASGVLLKTLYEVDDEAEVLKPIGYIGQPGESAEDIPADAPAPVAETAAPAAAPTPAAKPAGKAPVSPAAKRLAKELGVDLSAVTGTGPGGRIQKEDVQAASEGGGVPVPVADGDDVVPFSGMRKVIAERLSRSKQTIPHMYLSMDIDMENALAWRKAFNADNETHVTITDQIVYAAAHALKEFPRLNAHVQDGALVMKGSVNIGVATSVDDGLLVPVVKDAAAASIDALSAEIKRVVTAAREGKLETNVVGGFTVTSLGMFGVREFVPIINPPECAILGVGAVEDRVVARDGTAAVRKTMTVVLACDHRAIDGVYAAGFLGKMKEILEEAR